MAQVCSVPSSDKKSNKNKTTDLSCHGLACIEDQTSEVLSFPKPRFDIREFVRVMDGSKTLSKTPIVHKGEEQGGEATYRLEVFPGSPGRS